MPEVLVESAPDAAVEILPTPQEIRCPPQLRPYLFRPGQPAMPGSGRPKGSRNVAKLVEEAAPALTKHYLRRAKKSDPVLIDAMKRILPVENSDGAMTGPQVIIFLGDGELPRIPSDPQPVVSGPESA